MPLPTNPPISLSQIQAEFGAPSTTGITDFRRGGAYVPNTPANAGVPASGDIGLLHLLGATKYTPMSLVLSGGGSKVFDPEPAPTKMYLSGSLTLTINNGTAPFSVSWSRTAGDLAFSVVSGGMGINFGANVFKNVPVDATYRATVQDATGAVATVGRAIQLWYYTDQ